MPTYCSCPPLLLLLLLLLLLFLLLLCACVYVDRVTDFVFSPTNNMLTVSVGMDGSIKCYDVQTRK